MVTEAAVVPDLQRARDAVYSVLDPELPMLTLAELGIVREVSIDEGRVCVTLTPTYTGCPALREMTADVVGRLAAAGFAAAQVRTVLTPAWTTDWITDEGRRKLQAAGIAPPGPAPQRAGPIPLTLGRREAVVCPQCGSSDTVLTSRFGATACRSLHRCSNCAEPFEHMKEI